MLPFDAKKIIEAKGQEFKTQTSEKWNYCVSIPLQNLLSSHHHLHRRHMSKNLVVNLFQKENTLQSQLGYISYPELNENNLFKDKVEKELGLLF